MASALQLYAELLSPLSIYWSGLVFVAPVLSSAPSCVVRGNCRAGFQRSQRTASLHATIGVRSRAYSRILHSSPIYDQL